MLSVCLFIIGMIPAEGLSASYYKKFSRSISERVEVCVDLYKLAKREKVNPHLVLAVASIESGLLRKQVSPRGARGPLGVMPSQMRSMPCHAARNCTERDYALRGLQILGDIDRDMRESDAQLCNRLAQYNAGNKGKCDGVGGRYARLVIYRYNTLDVLTADSTCETC